jgi:uncharacterized protein YndB with AHSA1/START domain
MAFDFEFRMRIAAPRPTVFEKLLRIEHLSRWFCGWSRIEPKVGGNFKFGGETCILLPEGRGWETTIDEGEVLRRFAFRWPIRSAETRVSYDLDDGPDATALLTVRHRGVPIRETTCGTVQDAWRMCLGNLKSIAEGRGDSVRPDHSPVTSTDLRLSVLIEASLADVFDAFSDAKSLGHWSSGGVPRAEARLEPRSGGTIALGTGDGPDRVLGWSGEEGRAARFEFEEKASGTAVYLAESGFPSGDFGLVLRERGRWSDRFVGLKNFVESGSSGFTNAYEAQVHEI